ncbi:MAG: prolyl-tRNA synthetase associated domain-containing protein [Oscillospiraceae bacterium]|nr:prolyl-tRNA synthetase associated domain-containing protein [Oscillospiraceae bacterium]
MEAAGGTGEGAALGRQEVFELLRLHGVAFELAEHPAVYTIGEMLARHLPHPEDVAKNLFLRDDKKRGYYLVTLRGEKRADLRALRAQLGTRPLSFANEEELGAMLGLQKGAVTPFGLLNDAGGRVRAYVDADFCGRRIGVHPNDNTATVFLEADELLRVLRGAGARIEYAAVPQADLPEH